jgi:hypothetical protein
MTQKLFSEHKFSYEAVEECGLVVLTLSVAQLYETFFLPVSAAKKLEYMGNL